MKNMSQALIEPKGLEEDECRIRVGPDDKHILMRSSETILAASLREGIPHAYACGGRARCSICRISVEEGLEFCSPRSKGERMVAERLNFSPETRLACQTKITGNVNVRRLVVDDDDIEFTRTIAEGPRPASIGEEKKLAILFADVRSFTALSERMSPYDVIYFLNRYFHLASKVIESYGGYVDNYMGDGLLAVFGHDDAPDAAFRAVSAALTTLEEVDKRSRHFEQLYGVNVRIGVGIHHGNVVVGMIGAGDRRRTTVIGDPVNFASRIESANKKYGTELLVSNEVHRLVADRIIVGRRIEHVAIEGKTGEHVLYEVKTLKNPNNEQSV
jgi:adenylate cyclase